MTHQKNTENSQTFPRKITAIILAAGRGTRMKSPLPKVLHPVAGKPMIHYIMDACQRAAVSEIRVVLGYGHQLARPLVESHFTIQERSGPSAQERVEQFAQERVEQPVGPSENHLTAQVPIRSNPPQCFLQKEQLGTADAVRAAQIDSIEGDVLILNGDHPLISDQDLSRFIQEFQNNFNEEKGFGVAVVTTMLKKPKDFGRVVRKNGKFISIVEKNEATKEQLLIKEVNTGIYIISSEVLKKYLPMIQNHNRKKEYYFTDLISLVQKESMELHTLKGSPPVAFGVNSQEELAQATRWIFRRKARSLMDKGVLLFDPSTTYIEESVQVQSGAVIHPNVHLKGHTQIGSFSTVETGCVVIDSDLKEGILLRAYSHIEKSVLDSQCQVGPFARIRPESHIGKEAHVGNFVELKKVQFHDKAKASHLTYLGDAEIGEETNIGCGTITCNYAVDRKKYKTKIGKRVFVGSDSQFVAPVEVGDDAIIGSGSTITKNVPEKALAIARSKQWIKENYKKG